MLRPSRTEVAAWRRRVRAAAALAAVAAGAILALTPGGSAATTTKPYTATFGAGPVAGGASVTVHLHIVNLAAQQSLGSANITAASSSTGSFQITGAANVSSGTATVASASLVQLRNLNIAPNGGTFDVDLAVKAPCAAGSYSWGIQAKQSNDFNGTPGNDFTLQSGGATNLVTTVSGCKLAWATQPASAVVNTIITDTPYNPTVNPANPSGPKNVAVKAVDGAGNTLTSATGLVTLAKWSGSGGAFSGPSTQAQLVSGVATFPSLTSSATGSGLQLKASSPGFVDSPASSSFEVSVAGVVCTLGQDCLLPLTPINGTAQVEGTATGGTFTFLAVNPTSIPPAVTNQGGGCANFSTVGAAGFEETDGRTSLVGEKRFTYYVDKKLIQKKYGTNSGQQFIPLCAGAARVASDGTVINCKVDPNGPWKGKELSLDGRFDGNPANAVCDPDTGLYWGILGSFQDYTNSNPSLAIDPSSNPTVTGWDSNTTYRYFYIRIPSPWDWKVGS